LQQIFSIYTCRLARGILIFRGPVLFAGTHARCAGRWYSMVLAIAILVATAVLNPAQASAERLSTDTVLVAQEAGSCEPPESSATAGEAPAISDFMKFDHLPPFLDFLTGVRHDDYVQAHQALCRIVNATRTSQGKRMVAREMDQATFEALFEFRLVLAKVERTLAVVVNLRDLPEVTKRAVRDSAIEIGSACNACHQKTGGPGGVVPPNPRIRAILGD
jgi:hypothetical protein